MLSIYNYTVLVLVLKMISFAISDCPSLQYSSRDGFFSATMLVPSPHNNLIKFHLQLSVIGTQVSQQEIINNLTFEGIPDDITNNKPLAYKLVFPTRWNDFPKKITQITINNEIYCMSEKLNNPNGKNPTSELNLSHTIQAAVSSNSVTKKPLYNQPSVFTPPTQYYSRTQPIPYHFRTTTEPVNQNPQSNYCYQSPKSNALIYYGDDVKLGMYPWVGAVVKKESNSNVLEPQCGATLITEKLALTAGHCIVSKPIEKFLLIFGTINIDDTVSPDVQIAKIKTHQVHPGYKHQQADADLAILELSKTIGVSHVVQPICLCSATDCFENISEQKGVVAGWGKTENNQVSRTLKKIFTSIVDLEVCIRSHNTFWEIATERTFCAGYKNGTGPCEGDSGSGFYMYLKGQWTIRGVVSRALLSSDGSCNLNEYLVYVDVAKHLEWIKMCIDNIFTCHQYS